MTVRPRCAIFDFDGTIASVAWITPDSAHDNAGWHRFNSLTPFCSPVPAVLALVHQAIADGVVPIITTGRDGAFRHVQHAWLAKHAIPVTVVLGRRAGDQRKDSVVKHEILHEQILPRFRPVLAVDDRPVVADVWEAHGIPTIRVTDPGIDPPFLLGGHA